MRFPPPCWMSRPISTTRPTSERTCSWKSASTLARSSSTRATISLRPATLLRPTGSGDAKGTLPVVGELHVDAQVRPLQQLDHRLQIVPVLAGHTHLVALDGGLHLDLGPLDGLDDLPGLLGGNPFLEGDALSHRPPERLLDRPVGERLQGHGALDEARFEHVADGLELELVGGGQHELLALE